MRPFDSLSREQKRFLHDELPVSRKKPRPSLAHSLRSVRAPMQCDGDRQLLLLVEGCLELSVVRAFGRARAATSPCG